MPIQFPPDIVIRLLLKSDICFFKIYIRYGLIGSNFFKNKTNCVVIIDVSFDTYYLKGFSSVTIKNKILFINNKTWIFSMKEIDIIIVICYQIINISFCFILSW